MEPNLEQQLQDLPPGSSFNVTEANGDTTTYSKPLPSAVCADHDFQPVNEREDQCTKCGNGRVKG